MIVLFALLGLAVGWTVNRASDYLPRVALKQVPETIPSRPESPLALWRFVRAGSHTPWTGLHAITEGGSVVFLAALWLMVGLSWQLPVYLAGYVFFLLVAVIDIKYRLVLNVMLYPAAVLVLVIQVLGLRGSLLSLLIGGAFGFVIFYGSALVRPGGLGGGDIKLATLMGFTFGFPGILVALATGAGATALFIAYLFATQAGESAKQFPYAPFLCFGALAALLFSPLWMHSGVLL